MKEQSDKIERVDPHETYGVPRVPKSRAEALGRIKEELQKEMARRAGTYGRRLAGLLEGIEASRGAFEETLEAVRSSAIGCFGQKADRWSWGELVKRIEKLPAGSKEVLASEVRSIEGCAERHRRLRSEWEAVRQSLIIHREAMGFRRHHLVDEKFPTPRPLPPLEVAWQSGPSELEAAS